MPRSWFLRVIGEHAHLDGVAQQVVDRHRPLRGDKLDLPVTFDSDPSARERRQGIVPQTGDIDTAAFQHVDAALDSQANRVLARDG